MNEEPTVSEIKIKEGRLSKQTTGIAGELRLKVLFQANPFKEAYNSAVHPHPATHNGSAAGLNLNATESHAVSGFHWESNTSVAAFTLRLFTGNTFWVENPDVTVTFLQLLFHRLSQTE